VDVVVVGAAPAGSTMALLLARSGVRTTLLDSRRHVMPTAWETHPCIARTVITRLGLWDSILLDGSTFDCSLIKTAEAAGAFVFHAARLLDCEFGRDGRRKLSVAQGDSIKHLFAGYLVDATGHCRGNALQRLSRSISFDRLIGIQAFFPCARSTPYSIVEATEDGWFFSAAHSDRISITYFTDADIYSTSSQTPEACLASRLHAASLTRSRLSGTLLPQRAYIVSVATVRRVEVCGDHWIAIGDAALAFDPLSSLGVFKALDSAERAAASIVNANGLDYRNWSRITFERYLPHRNSFYSDERRWERSLFWARRHTTGSDDCHSKRKQEPGNRISVPV
jgi:flavin-dependent dehydrogenase